MGSSSKAKKKKKVTAEAAGATTDTSAGGAGSSAAGGARPRLDPNAISHEQMAKLKELATGMRQESDFKVHTRRSSTTAESYFMDDDDIESLVDVMDERERLKTNLKPLLLKLGVLIALCVAVLNFFGFACYADSNCDAELHGSALVYWALFIDSVIVAWPIAKLVSSIVFYVVHHTRGMEYVYYLILPLHTSAHYIVWGLFLMNIWRVVLVDVDEAQMEGFELVAQAMAISFWVYAIKVVFLRFLEDYATDHDVQSRCRRLEFYEEAMSQLVREEVLIHKTRRHGLLTPTGKSLKMMKDMLDAVEEDVAESHDTLGLHQDDDKIEVAATALAQKVFQKVDKGKRGFIEESMLKEYMDPHMVARFFRRMDIRQDGLVSREELSTAIYRLLEEKRLVHYAVEDQKNVFSIVRKFVTGVAWLIILFVVLNAFGLSPLTLLLPLATLFLGFAIIFGETVRTIVEALMIIFFGRPFSIGDTIKLDDGDELTVRHVGFLATIFKCEDGSIAYVPNTTLSGSTIVNLRRSEDVVLEQELIVSGKTPPNKLRLFSEALEAYAAERPKVYNPASTSVIIDGITPKGNFVMLVSASLSSTWHDADVWEPAKTKLLSFVSMKLLELEIDVGSDRVGGHKPVHITFKEPMTVEDLRASADEAINEKEVYRREMEALVEQLVEARMELMDIKGSTVEQRRF